MKNLLSLIVLMSAMTLIVSCGDDDTTPDNDATITGVTASVSIDNLGTYGPVTVTVGAADGLAGLAITKDGAAFDAVTYTGETTADYSFEYTAVAADGDKNVVFEFTVTDTDGDTESSSLVLSVGAATAVLPDETKAGLISANETWTADRIYILGGRVIVEEGVTLTIEPGTIIKGKEGTGSLASALIISRGAKIMAEGTADKPIIFTSILDDIAVGQKIGTTLSKTDNETWGGLIILGSAPVSAKVGDDEAAIEGIPADEPFGKYGAINGVADVADNSGVLKYVSIRHGGSLIGDGNEINGLTLGGVGTGTTIEYVEVYATLDDGVEFFGGSVNAKNILVYWQGDDGIDIDQNYSGTVDNWIVSHGDGVGTDEALEIDGPENTLKDGKFTLINGTIITDGIAGGNADIKSDAQGTLSNVKFATSSTLKFEGEYSKDDCSAHGDGTNGTKVYTDALQNFLDDNFIVTGSEFGSISVVSKQDDDKVALCASVPAADQTAAEAKATSTTATGADGSAFAWTAAVLSGDASF